MELTEKVNEGIKEAMKAKDQKKLKALRAIKSAILLLNTDVNSNKDSRTERELQMLQKMVKQRKESAEIYSTQSREDLAQEEIEEAEVIEAFLPEQLSDEELIEEIKQIINELDAQTMQDMGKVMGAATKKLSGRAPGKKIAEVVRLLLN